MGIIHKEKDGTYTVRNGINGYDFGSFDDAGQAEKFCEDFFGTDWGWA